SFNMYQLSFFFQAEDGIRDPLVTGVQTCALPILARINDGLGSGVACPALHHERTGPNRRGILTRAAITEGDGLVPGILDVAEVRVRVVDLRRRLEVVLPDVHRDDRQEERVVEYKGVAAVNDPGDGVGRELE